MPRLIWVFAGRTCHFVGFVMRWLINLFLYLYFRILHTRLQTAVLRSDYHGQASLLNLLLRNYLHYNLIEQADKLVSKSTFPESASNNDWARFLYYLGKFMYTFLDLLNTVQGVAELLYWLGVVANIELLKLCVKVFELFILPNL